MSRSVRVLLPALCCLLSGCATLKNTPQQDYVYDMARPSAYWEKERGWAPKG